MSRDNGLMAALGFLRMKLFDGDFAEMYLAKHKRNYQ